MTVHNSKSPSVRGDVDNEQSQSLECQPRAVTSWRYRLTSDLFIIQSEFGGAKVEDAHVCQLPAIDGARPTSIRPEVIGNTYKRPKYYSGEKFIDTTYSYKYQNAQIVEFGML